MPEQRMCPYCLRPFIPDPRRKERQATCARQECRRKRKRQSDKEWRSRHQNYFRGIYRQQKEDYGTRAEYKNSIADGIPIMFAAMLHSLKSTESAIGKRNLTMKVTQAVICAYLFGKKRVASRLPM